MALYTSVQPPPAASSSSALLLPHERPKQASIPSSPSSPPKGTNEQQKSSSLASPWRSKQQPLPLLAMAQQLSFFPTERQASRAGWRPPACIFPTQSTSTRQAPVSHGASTFQLLLLFFCTTHGESEQTASAPATYLLLFSSSKTGSRLQVHLLLPFFLPVQSPNPSCASPPCLSQIGACAPARRRRATPAGVPRRGGFRRDASLQQLPATRPLLHGDDAPVAPTVGLLFPLVSTFLLLPERISISSTALNLLAYRRQQQRRQLPIVPPPLQFPWCSTNARGNAQQGRPALQQCRIKAALHVIVESSKGEALVPSSILHLVNHMPNLTPIQMLRMRAVSTIGTTFEFMGGVDRHGYTTSLHQLVPASTFFLPQALGEDADPFSCDAGLRADEPSACYRLAVVPMSFSLMRMPVRPSSRVFSQGTFPCVDMIRHWHTRRGWAPLETQDEHRMA
ncbi:hypothetical protein U9M48_024118 [Paspalum notatum var. saurae]|uniref:Uncharacterized protein n=1 Tax=Paspalum notatum var. saurae TaxID=547442 RepID=A0AAQ3TQ59_PASNO